MPKKLTFVIDSNVLSQRSFDSLRPLPLPLLCRRGTFELIYPNVMLEETLESYASEKTRRSLIEDWIPLVLNTARRLPADLETILTRELVLGKGAKASIFLNTGIEATLRAHLRALPADGTWPLIGATAQEREANRKAREERRRRSLEARAELRKQLQRQRVRIDHVSLAAHFRQTHSEYIELMARRLIERLDAMNADVLFDQWRSNQAAYPFLTQFSEDVVFQELHFIANPNGCLDENAQSDLEIMGHLLRGDVLVSNETGFLRQAFDQIWRPRNKRLVSTEQFADLIRANG